MDITVVGRNAEISSRLRDYVEEKATKVEQSEFFNPNGPIFLRYTVFIR